MDPDFLKCPAAADRVRTRLFVAALVAVLSLAPARSAEWPSRRGPHQDGTSSETGLVSSWSPQGENLVWKVDFVGRSTPVVLHGQVCVIGRVGGDIDRQEVVACYEAENGRQRWEHRFSVYHTTVPFNRVGWASLAADTETGNIYAHGVGGQLFAFGADGRVLWSYYLPERFGRISGYGGRTQTPLVEGDLLILSFVNSGWGEQAAPRHRYFAFDKRTGELIWVSTPGDFPKDMNTQGGAVVAEIGGRRMLVSGNADGWIYALDVATGALIWKFHLSKRGINVQPVVTGRRVYISHSEENIDTPDMGRLVAIDGGGKGDVTKTHEIWRINELQAGFPSPMLHDDKLYVIDNSANLRRLDAETGKEDWVYSLGTVGKGSAVWADGKLYVGEVNGRFHILKPGREGCNPLDMEQLHVPGGRYAEIYGSPAVAYGRVYFAAESGLYALGSKDRPFRAPARRAGSGKRKAKPVAGTPVAIQVVPAEVLSEPGEKLTFRIRAVDARGREVLAPRGEWSLEGLSGKVEAGRFRADPDTPFQVGEVQFKAGKSTARARVRVIGRLPWSEDFESFGTDEIPPHWIGAAGKFKVAELDGNKVLVQPPRQRGLQRGYTFLGPSDWGNYTIQVDFRATQAKRRRPDVGVMAAGYTLDLQGNSQKLQIRSWTSTLRMARELPFQWDMETWYTMRMRVEVEGGKAVVHGKVWKAGTPEPDAWTLTAEDPFPVEVGSPGLIGYAPAEIYYDNLKVWMNK